MSIDCRSSSHEDVKYQIEEEYEAKHTSQCITSGKRYILINGDDPTVLLASDKQHSNSKEHANSNNISRYPQGYLMQRKDHAKMISDSNSTKHEENGNANLREDKRVPLHVCCCCGSGCNFKTRRKCSSCTNNDLRNCQHLKPNTLRACHNSTKEAESNDMNHLTLDTHNSHNSSSQSCSSPSSVSSKMTFKDFCQSTSLHGWQYLGGMEYQKSKFIWVFIVVASLGVASVFLCTAGYEFINKVVVTTIDTTTASLQDVYFPSVIVCNINQIRRSLFRGLGIKNYSDIDLLYHQFYTGLDRNLTSDEQKTILSLATSELMVKRLMTHYTMYAKSNTTDVNKEITKNWEEFLHNNTDFIHPFDFVKDMAVEDPGDSPVISARYGRHRMSRINATDFLPFFGTDIGFCSLVRPQVNFNPEYDDLPFNVKMFGPKPKGKENVQTYTWRIKPGAKVGKANGLTLLLDANVFDYTFHRHASEGFKIAVEHHLDQPLMSMKELDITPGLETQVAVTPVLYSTTDAARSRFSPIERGCYFEGELSLAYLPKGLYRYGISNCLFEATYEKVLEICRCTPYFHWAGMKKHRTFCRGSALVCMNQVFDRIGEYNEITEEDDSSPSPNSNQTNKKIRKKICLAACEDQQNNVAMTTSRLPNRQTMLEWPDFCVVLRKIARSCEQPWKRVDLDKAYPSLCSSLLNKIHKESKMKQSQNLNSENVFEKDEATDGCRKMFSGFNILDNKNSKDVIAEIQGSSFKATRQLSSSPSLDKSEPTASPISNSHSKLQSKLKNEDWNIENNVTVSNEEDIELLNAIFSYARENVALVNIYIKPPVVTRILRDQRTPIIWFVANCGGILGLCMGFSIVTVFEVLHYLSQSLCGKFRDCLPCPKLFSCCEKQKLMGESLISRQPKRSCNNSSSNHKDLNVVDESKSRSPPDSIRKYKYNRRSNCCCIDGVNLSDLNDGNVTKQLLYAQTNPANTDNTVEHRFVTLAQVPTITAKDLANDTLSNISSLRTNETSF